MRRASGAREEKLGRGREEIKHRKHSDLTPANSILHVLLTLGESAAKKVEVRNKGNEG